MPTDQLDHFSSPSTDILTASASTPSYSAIDDAGILGGPATLFADNASLGTLFPGLAVPSAKRPRSSSQHHRSSPPVDPDALAKRQRNNIAAKKYRQKKVDRIKELEDEVEVVKRERDALRIRLARQEAETAALRDMLRLGPSGPSSSESTDS